MAIVPPFVYKVKKPVDFGFLDFSTVEKRQFYLNRELELNRRLSSGIYLTVIPIGQRNGQLSFGKGRCIDYALKMRKLSDRYFLDRLVDRGQIRRKDMDRIIFTLKTFYHQAPSGRAVEPWGQMKHVRKATNDNFRLTRPFVGQAISSATIEAVKSYTNRFYYHQQSLFEKRVKEQRIRDCHGDLHLEHIHLGPKTIQIYDCIEFNERLRHIDVASDIGFLAMDLDFHGRPDLSRYLVERMSQRLDDPDMLKLTDFYKCYRAFVRGKVECLRSAETEPSPVERRRSQERARRYFQLALSYVVAGSRPMILLVMGRIASGKSTLATALGEELNWPVISSDVTRKTLAQVPLKERPNPKDRARIYSRSMTRRTYNALFEQANKSAGEGKSVIIDATFSQRIDRDQFRRRLEKKAIPHKFIEARTPLATVRKRLKQRALDLNVISDARLEDFNTIDQLYDPPKELPEGHILTATTSGPIEVTLQKTLKRLAELNSSR